MTIMTMMVIKTTMEATMTMRWGWLSRRTEEEGNLDDDGGGLKKNKEKVKNRKKEEMEDGALTSKIYIMNVTMTFCLNKV
jgi:hypothetical protein